jgi:hypothetical protein
VPVAKLPFGEVLAESFGFFLGNLALFFHLVTIPWIISIAIRIVGTLVGEDVPITALTEKAADSVPTVMFMVAWQRAVLLDRFGLVAEEDLALMLGVSVKTLKNKPRDKLPMDIRRVGGKKFYTADSVREFFAAHEVRSAA